MSTSTSSYYGANRTLLQCAVSSWKLTNGLTSMEKYGVNQSWEGCNRTVQYRSYFEYVDYTATTKVIKLDANTKQYTEF